MIEYVIFLHFGMIPMTSSRAPRFALQRFRPPPSGATAPSSRRRRRSGLRRCRRVGRWRRWAHWIWEIYGIQWMNCRFVDSADSQMGF